MKRLVVAAVASLSLTVAARSARAQEPLVPMGAAPAPPAPAPSASAPPALVGTVRIHVRTFRNKGRASVYARRADGSYALVCAAPCSAAVPANAELLATSNGNDDEPHAFVVPTDLGPEVDIEVRPPSVGPLVGGIVLMGTGGAVLLSGLLCIAVADLADTSSRSSAASSGDTLRTAGYVMLGTGAAAAVGGLVWLTSRSLEPRVVDSPHREPFIYGRAETLLGDVAVARPRDATTLAAPPIMPLRLGFAF